MRNWSKIGKQQEPGQCPRGFTDAKRPEKLCEKKGCWERLLRNWNRRNRMCGIAGFCNLKGNWEENIRKMNARMNHRGPDGEGIYISEDGG